MLTKKRRLSSDEIEKVKKHGTYYQTPLFALLCMEAEEGASRFASIFSRRLDKRATVRNRAKRLLMGATRELLSEIKEGYLLLFLPKKTILEEEKEAIKEEVRQAFSQADILRERR